MGFGYQTNGKTLSKHTSFIDTISLYQRGSVAFETPTHTNTNKILMRYTYLFRVVIEALVACEVISSSSSAQAVATRKLRVLQLRL